MSGYSQLIVKGHLRPGVEGEFATWKARHDIVLAKFPGYVGGDIIPPAEAAGVWTVVLNFQTWDALERWRKSPERAEVIKEGVRLLINGEFVEEARADDALDPNNRTVTEVIFSKVKEGREDQYREWAARIQAAQARYPGYKGTFLQPPENAGGMWTTVMRYGGLAELEAWLASPERKTLLEEATEFVEHEQLTRLATSFPGWVPVDPVTGKGPPNWKTAMLVLLGLFPIVMLEMKYLSPVFSAWGLHASLATFIGNSLSVAATSFWTMPLFVRWFGWWLFPVHATAGATTAKGLVLILVLYAAEVLALWKLLPW